MVTWSPSVPGGHLVLNAISIAEVGVEEGGIALGGGGAQKSLLKLIGGGGIKVFDVNFSHSPTPPPPPLPFP